MNSTGSLEEKEEEYKNQIKDKFAGGSGHHLLVLTPKQIMKYIGSCKIGGRK